MSYSIESQVKLIEEKKQELLMKTSTKNKQTPTPNTASQSAISPAAAPSGPSLFMNDGNFLARFQAMQKQNTPSGTTQDNEKNSGKFSIKLSNVKKKDQPKVVATNSSAFEKHNPLSADEESSAKIKEDPSSSYQYSSQTSTQRNDSKFRQTPDAPGAAAVASSSSSLLGKRKRKNRWDEKSEEDCSSTASSDAQLPSSSLAAASSPGGSNLAPASSSNENPADIMAEFQKAKALIQQKAAQAKSALSAQSMEQQRQIQEQKLMQEMYMKIIEEQAAAAKKRIKKKEDKPRYEYDSDEDIDGGTWEHKKRMKEMEKTRADAQKLTEMSKGKHHMSDFLPKEELAKFEEKVRAIKEGRKADLSDYAEFKIKEDNIGFKMLQKAGWQEGKGLGSEGKGITEPINKGQTSLDNSGVGVEKPHEVEKDDDQFDIYRKRMMLAYKFRPNPLNNPRRPYY